MNQVIIMAGGKGTRMNMTDKPKTMIPVAGKPIVEHIVEAAERAVPETKPVIIIGFQGHTIVDHFGDRAVCVEQKEQLGTGHAVSCAAHLFRERSDIGHVVVLAGDQPLVSAGTIHSILSHHENGGETVTLGTVVVPDYTGINEHLLHYGRIVRKEDGSVERIVEYKDATEEERSIREVNTSIYCFDSAWLWEHIDRLGSDNASKEFYITDLIAMAMAEGRNLAAVSLPDPVEGLNVNTPDQLRAIEEIIVGTSGNIPSTSHLTHAYVS
ncbi:MAG: NTP transferase domain-containing protein [Candidatus Moranbacteria bacterium]|nr:NTP transferase domain-containing protein [Candidatus Moranbacteria bacterium]